MADYAAAVERAQSRAAVLQSLQASYGSGKTNSTANKPSGTNSNQKNTSSNQSKKAPAAPTTSADTANAAVNNSDKGVVNEMVDILMGALGDQTMKSKQFFKDSLRGKAIVVENVKAQLDASKASKRIELAGKRKQTISNRALKRLRVASPSDLPSDTEITALHDLWWEYATQLMGNCHSEAQLQARLYSMEYVGARVYVIYSSCASLIGTVGIITAVSKNCFFLAVDTDNSGTSSGAPKKTNTTKSSDNTTTVPVNGNITAAADNATTTPTALTLVKATTTIGVVLPSLHSKHKPHTLFTDDAEVVANTTANANSGNIALTSGTDNHSGVGSAGASINIGSSINDNSSGGYKFDHNEREGGGRICVLYGKHFMPHCKYD